MLDYITQVLHGLANKAVNYDRMKEITQRPQENPGEFLERLSQALQKCTRIAPTSLAGTALLHSHFISQLAPDIRKKLKKLEDGPRTPQRKLLNVAFKVFHNREE